MRPKVSAPYHEALLGAKGMANCPRRNWQAKAGPSRYRSHLASPFDAAVFGLAEALQLPG